MAQNQIIPVKQALVAAWSAILPQIEGSSTPVGCDYSWPGAKQKAEHIWFYGARTQVTDVALKAGRRWRDVVTSTDVVIEVSRKGKQTDETSAVVLQPVVDERCDYLLGLLDEWVADNPNLGFGPGTSTDNTFAITGALIEAHDFEHGPIENGCAARNIARLTYYARVK
jgi:hypothetical protein